MVQYLHFRILKIPLIYGINSVLMRYTRDLEYGKHSLNNFEKTRDICRPRDFLTSIRGPWGTAFGQHLVISCVSLDFLNQQTSVCLWTLYDFGKHFFTNSLSPAPCMVYVPLFTYIWVIFGATASKYSSTMVRMWFIT